MIIYLRREEENLLIKMIYTYLFTDKFFNDWRSNINTEQSQVIYDFFKEKFQNKENIFYCGKEDILNKVHGLSGPNSNLIDFFLTEFISSGCKSIFSNKEKIADFIFCGNDESISEIPFSITCHDIINNKDLKKTIKEKTEDLWSNRKGKEDLILKLDKLLKLSKSVFFVDRHVPGVVVDQNKKQINQWNKSLKFYNTLLSKSKTKSFFISAIKNEYLTRYKNKSNIIDFEPHEKLKEDLRNFYKVLETVKTIVMVKDQNAFYSGLHDRFIFFFFDNNHVLEKALRDRTLLILEVSQGLNILDGKGKTTLPRRLTRQTTESCKEIVEEWVKNVENKPLFDKFIAGEDKIDKKVS